MYAGKTVAVEALMTLGMALLAFSLRPVAGILAILPAGRLRTSWMALRGLIVCFLLGYGVFAWSLLHTTLSTQLLLVVLIMFLGSCFVTSVTLLSRETANDLLHMVSLKQQVDVDPLTGLFNRRYLERRLAEEVERASRYGLPLAVLLFDVDRFKAVNDTYGHPTGDGVLTRVGEAVSQNIRTNDVAVRYGGEEFIVIAPETDGEPAHSLAERLRLAVQELRIPVAGGTTLSVSISIGVARLRTRETAAALVSRADQALYQAKRSGRNRVVDSA